MTRNAQLEKILEHVIDQTAKALTNSGFVRRGATLRKIADGNVAIIEFQKSVKSASHALIFTINLGIFCGELDTNGLALSKAHSVDAQFRQRIGMLLPNRPDKWWQVIDTSNENALAQEVSDLVTGKAVPYLESYLRTDALVALWESGQSPGLTATQRSRYLSELKTKRENK